MIKGSILPEDITIPNMYAPINSTKLCGAKTDRTPKEK